MDSCTNHRIVSLSLASHSLESIHDLFSNLSLRRTTASAPDDTSRSASYNELALEVHVIEQLRRIIELRNDRLSPTARLNDDTLRRIFQYCVEPNWDQIINEQRPDSMTLRLSHVSRRWRSLTISSPSLWSSILLTLWYNPRHGNAHVIFPHVAAPEHPLSAQILKIMGKPYTSFLLQRAGHSMLSVTITSRQPIRRWPGPSVSPLEPLVILKDRISSLRLHLPDVCTHSILWTTVSGNLCCLQRLTIFSKHVGYTAHHGQLLWEIIETPFQCLRHLTISCTAPLPYTGDGLPTHVHCETLELRLNRLDSESYRHHSILHATLKRFPNLKKLGIGILPKEWQHELLEEGADYSVEPVTLSRLHALSLEVDGPDLLPIIRALHAPSTRELHIATKFPRGARTPTTFASGSPQLSTSPAYREPCRILKSFVARCAHLTHVELVGIPAEVLPDLLEDQNQINAFACLAVGLTEDAWNKLLCTLLPTQKPDLGDVHFYNVFRPSAMQSLLTWLQDPSRQTRIRSLEYKSYDSGYQPVSCADLEHLMSREVDKLVISQHRVYPDWTREKCPPGNIFPTSFELSFGMDSEFYTHGMAIIYPPFHE
ncbi:hypothetical protein CALVIDRAFT_119515 [Calocera viscosa TUFC12733]|uniref:Uncharacterized protein n=1 Tax=Calocera viscosa (strain TUFC12733) TaxID=1330018 RepID=A0A167M9Z3_CALVF|nr:hypothetical protein CALVIDRAFT_119515 [Calocera viscosa TUFC12733]